MSTSVIYIIFVAFVSDYGKLLTATQNVDITTCDGSTKAGSVIFVKYSEIKSHCECKVNPKFIGVLRFASNEIKFACYTEINIFENGKRGGVLRLACGLRTYGRFNVTSDSVLYMTSKYVNSTNGQFTQEVTIFEDKTFNGTISVTCGGDSMSISTTVLPRTTNTENTNLKITGKDKVSFETVTNDIQSKDKTDSTIIHIIAGASGTIAVLLAIIISFVVCHMRRTQLAPRTTGVTDDTYSGNLNKGVYNELPDNPLYHSYQPKNEENQNYAQPNKDKDQHQVKYDRKSITQVNSDDGDIVYAKVNKP